MNRMSSHHRSPLRRAVPIIGVVAALTTGTVGASVDDDRITVTGRPSEEVAVATADALSHAPSVAGFDPSPYRTFENPYESPFSTEPADVPDDGVMANGASVVAFDGLAANLSFVPDGDTVSGEAASYGAPDDEFAIEGSYGIATVVGQNALSLSAQYQDVNVAVRMPGLPVAPAADPSTGVVNDPAEGFNVILGYANVRDVWQATFLQWNGEEWQQFSAPHDAWYRTWDGNFAVSLFIPPRFIQGAERIEVHVSGFVWDALADLSILPWFSRALIPLPLSTVEELLPTLTMGPIGADVAAVAGGAIDQPVAADPTATGTGDGTAGTDTGDDGNDDDGEDGAADDEPAADETDTTDGSAPNDAEGDGETADDTTTGPDDEAEAPATDDDGSGDTDSADGSDDSLGDDDGAEGDSANAAPADDGDATGEQTETGTDGTDTVDSGTPDVGTDGDGDDDGSSAVLWILVVLGGVVFLAGLAWVVARFGGPSCFPFGFLPWTQPGDTPPKLDPEKDPEAGGAMMSSADDDVASL